MRTEKITFLNSRKIALAARIDRPEDRDPTAYVLASHCFTCTKDLPAMHHLTTALVERGIGVMRFDFTGLGSSGGTFSESGFKDNLDDIESAVDFLTERGLGPHILFGHSLGGTAMLVAAHKVPSALVVATMAWARLPSRCMPFIYRRHRGTN